MSIGNQENFLLATEILNEIKKNILIVILPLILTLILYLIFIFKLRLSPKKL